MTRTIVDIPQDKIDLLDMFSKEEGVSRAELVRQGVESILEKLTKKRAGEIIGPDIRGMFADGQAFDGLDGVEYQRKIRSEWDHRDALYADWGNLTLEEFKKRMDDYSKSED